MRTLKVLALSLLMLATATMAYGQSSAAQELKRLEAEQAKREQRVGSLLDTAGKAAQDAEALARRLVEAAADRDRLEREVEQSEGRLIALRTQERNLTGRLLANRAALEDVVIALIAMERDRPPALAVAPRNAAEAARAAILMGEIAPILEARAKRAALDIQSLRQLREELLMQNTRYRDSTLRLQTARQTIGALIQERRTVQARLLRDADNERSRISEIVRRSNDLRDLVARLGGALPGLSGFDRNQGSSFASGFESAQGKVAYPTVGQIVIAYGASLETGGRSEGVTIRTRRAAQVTAPYDAEVEFAGPFRSYGRVLILNVGSGYHIVLAGLSDTYAEAGQEVLAGEPIGEMAADLRIVPDLYMEVRKASAPLNPAAWLKRPGGA